MGDRPRPVVPVAVLVTLVVFFLLPGYFKKFAEKDRLQSSANYTAMRLARSADPVSASPASSDSQIATNVDGVQSK